jgi:hypothetical protein
MFGYTTVAGSATKERVTLLGSIAVATARTVDRSNPPEN